MTKTEELALEISYATSDVDISYEDWLFKLENLLEAREKEIVRWYDNLASSLANEFKTEEYNNRIAPILREKGKELGIKWLQ